MVGLTPVWQKAMLLCVWVCSIVVVVVVAVAEAVADTLHLPPRSFGRNSCAVAFLAQRKERKLKCLGVWQKCNFRALRMEVLVVVVPACHPPSRPRPGARRQVSASSTQSTLPGWKYQRRQGRVKREGWEEDRGSRIEARLTFLVVKY